MQRGSKRFQRVKASVKLGVEAMQKLTSGTVVPNVECHNCHTKNLATRCFCRKCGMRLIHSYG